MLRTISALVDCGCKVEIDAEEEASRDYTGIVRRCALHKAAPDLLKACRVLRFDLEARITIEESKTMHSMTLARAAIAAAKKGA